MQQHAGLLILLFLTEYVRGAFFFTFLPFWVVNHLNLSITIVGFAVSTYYLTETLLKTFAGWKFDRLGRPVLMGGLVLSLISLLLIKNWPNPIVIIIAAGLFGLGFSPLWPAVISRLAPVGIPNRATRISMVFATCLAGTGIGIISTNFIMAYEKFFYLVIFLWMISLIMAWFSASNHKENAPSLEYYNIWHALQYMSSNKILVRILLPGMFLQMTAVGLLIPVLPLFVQQHLHLNHNQYGLLLLTGGTTAIVCLLPMGYLADRVALKSLLGLGFGGSSFFLVCLTRSNEIKETFIFSILLGFSYAVLLPAWNSLLARTIPPNSQATGWGVFGTIEGLGITVGPALGSLIAKYLGMSSTLISTAGVLLIAALFYLFYPVEKMLPKE